MKSYFLLLTALAFNCLYLGAKTYDVRTFGARGDGKHIDSPAINAAIREAAAAGGGTVYVPAGTYACYSIRLLSHITLYLESGATLLAEYPKGPTTIGGTVDETTGYDLAESNVHNRFQDFGHSHWKNSLLWAIGQEDITLCGSGLIHGKGLTREESRLPGVGNKAVSLRDCRNVTIKDLSLLMCGHFAVLATGVDNLTLQNVKVDTNRDGFDIDCCRNVRVSNCSVNAPWDDAIVLKASYALGRFKDTECVTIDNCYVSGYDKGTVHDGTYRLEETQAPDHGFRTGRIKLGTESSGGFRNIAITNCVFEHCRGLALETVDGGHLEDVVVSNITMRHITNSPIFLRLGARMRSPEGTPVGTLKRVSLSHINVYDADGRYASIISGIPGHCVEDVTLDHIRIHYRGGYTPQDASVSVPEQEKVYPEPWMFGTIPASGFFLRHIRGLQITDCHYSFEQPDSRPLYTEIDVVR